MASHGLKGFKKIIRSKKIVTFIKLRAKKSVKILLICG